MSTTILSTILARKHEEVAERRARVSLDALKARIVDAPSLRGFADAIEAKIAAGLPVVIAEDPLTCVARGGGRMLELIDEHGPAFFNLE